MKGSEDFKWNEDMILKHNKGKCKQKNKEIDRAHGGEKRQEINRYPQRRMEKEVESAHTLPHTHRERERENKARIIMHHIHASFIPHRKSFPECSLAS